MKEEIFISVMGIFIIFNTFYYLMQGSLTSLLVGGVASMLLIITTAVMISIGIGVQVEVFGSSVSLSDSSVKIVFVTLILINVLYSANLFGFTVGLGLASNMATVFNNGDFLGLGTVLASLLSFIALFCGILLIAEDS